MKRIDVIRAVTAMKGLIICNLGLPSRELFSLCDRPVHFYMLGSMGMASSIGLGLALAQPKRVYVIEGDGSLLMNLASLTTVGLHAPPNYCLIVVDNMCYSSTGNQPTRTAYRTDLSQVAGACGITAVKAIDSLSGLTDCLHRFRNQSLTVVARTEDYNADAGQVSLSPRFIAKRFMNAVQENGES